MRNWKSVALGSACLLAVGCGGGGGGETTSAGMESQSMGGEGAGASGTADPYVAYESDTAGMSGDVTAGTDTDVIQSDDARDTYSGGMTGQTDQSFGDRDVTGSGIGSTEPLDEDRLAQGTQQDTFGQPMDQPPTGEQGMGQQQGMQQPMQQQQPIATAEEICPADIEGLNVRASTIPRGGALVFTVAREQVQDLRDRLNRFAELHMQQHQGAHGSMQHQQQEGMGSSSGTPSGSASVGAGGVGAGGSIGAGGASGSIGAGSAGGGTASGSESVEFVDAQALIHQASEIRVVETPRGARLEVRLEDPDRVRDLRAELRENATMLRDGRCPLALQIAS